MPHPSPYQLPHQFLVCSFGINDSIELGKPMEYIPYHMVALLAELEYARDKPATLGFKTDDLGLVARAIYGDLQDILLDKMEMELAELGHRWSATIPRELEDAIRRR